VGSLYKGKNATDLMIFKKELLWIRKKYEF